MIDLYFHPTPNPGEALRREFAGEGIHVRDGEARTQMIALSRNDPAALDRRFAGTKAALGDAVRDHSAL